MKASSEEIYGKSTQGTMLKSTFSGLQRCRRRYGSIFIASQICEITPNSLKIRADTVQGHRSWFQSKAHMRLPISH